MQNKEKKLKPIMLKNAKLHNNTIVVGGLLVYDVTMTCSVFGIF